MTTLSDIQRKRSTDIDAMRSRQTKSEKGAEAFNGSGDAEELVSRVTEGKISIGELALLAGVSEAGLLVSWTTIDPDVVRGAQEVFTSSSIHGNYDYVDFILSHYSRQSAASQLSTFHKLVGYAGEQRYFDLMTANGHTVVQAASSNNPVWDFIVDGKAVNVKAWNDISGLHHIATEHPDVSFAVPEDIVGHVSGNIHLIPGLNHSQLVDAVNHSIGAASGDDALAAFAHHIPFIALGMITYREYHKVRAGKEWDAAVEQGAVTLSTRTIGAIGGMKFGMALGGMIAGHYGVIVGAPIGTYLGVYGSSRLNRAILSVPHRTTMRGLEKALVRFGEGGLAGVAVMRRITSDHLDRLADTAFALRMFADTVVKAQRWADWPSEEDFGIILAAEAAEVQFQDASRRARDLTGALDRASERDRSGLMQWGALLAGAPSFARECGANVVELAAVVSKQKLVARERSRLAQYAR